jgi:hypothetical protein
LLRDNIHIVLSGKHEAMCSDFKKTYFDSFSKFFAFLLNNMFIVFGSNKKLTNCPNIKIYI